MRAAIVDGERLAFLYVDDDRYRCAVRDDDGPSRLNFTRRANINGGLGRLFCCLGHVFILARRALPPAWTMPRSVAIATASVRFLHPVF